MRQTPRRSPKLSVASLRSSVPPGDHVVSQGWIILAKLQGLWLKSIRVQGVGRDHDSSESRHVATPVLQSELWLWALVHTRR